MSTRRNTMLAHLAELAGEGEHFNDTTAAWEQADFADKHPFLLIERSVYDASLFVTVHESLAEAADYHDVQEYPDDWTIEYVLDLDTGERYVEAGRTTKLVKED